MIQVPPQMRIRVSVEPADFRKGINGLARVCREALHSDPFSGCVFVFCNKSRKAVKILVYDGQVSGCLRSGSRRVGSHGARRARQQPRLFKPTSLRSCCPAAIRQQPVGSLPASG